MSDDDDLRPVPFLELSWQETDLAASLAAVYTWVEAEGIRSAEWYLREKRAKAQWSRCLRIAAIVLVTAGAAVPLALGDSGFQWGYTLLALGAGAVAIDRFFGFSSAWIRYIGAELAIQHRLQQLQFEWAAILLARGNRQPSQLEAAKLLDTLAAAATGFGEEVRRETVAWAEEFQSNIGELRAIAEQQRQRP